MNFCEKARKGAAGTMDKRKKVSLGQAAWRAVKAHPARAAGEALLQVLVRAAALLPLALPMLTGQPLPLPGGAVWALTGLLYLLLVIPMRFHGGEILRYLSGPQEKKPAGGKPYWFWLRSGLLRVGRGLLWGLPFLFCVGYFVYGHWHMPFPDMWAPVLALTLPGSAAIVLASALLFAYGWWRDLPMEYLPARHLAPGEVLFFTRRIRRRDGDLLRKNTAVNMLLALPALAGFLAVLTPYVLGLLPASGDVQTLILSLQTLLRQPLPAGQTAALAAVYFALYVPLCLIRKLRSAVLVRRKTKELSGLGERHAAG